MVFACGWNHGRVNQMRGLCNVEPNVIMVWRRYYQHARVVECGLEAIPQSVGVRGVQVCAD